jgi:hypothetical protein
MKLSRPLAVSVPLFLSLALLGACSGDPPSGTSSSTGSGGAGGHGGASPDFVSAAKADGFQVQEGTFKLLDLADCCAAGKSCSGNNPSSPYAAYYLPRAPEQSAPNVQEDAQGLSPSYRLRADEAVVWIGETPPPAAYFGFTDYLMSRDDGTGNRVPVFASLAETLNINVIAVDGPMDGKKSGRQTLVIHSADAGIAARVRSDAIAAGWPESAININPIDAVNTHLGIDAEGDTLGVLFRVALFDDSAAGKAWLDAPPAKVYRLTPTSAPAMPQPYGKATARPKDTKTDENPTYATAAEQLRQAILATYAGTYTAIEEDVTEGTPDPYACIAGDKSCAGDNRDTIYPATKPFLWLTGADDFIIVHGVDHHSATGKATYGNASVYAIEHLVGVASVNSKEWKGSAAKYLPNNPLADHLFAYKIARNCNGEPYCLQIPDGTCPTGIAPGKLASIAFRAYLEPTTNTAPDPAMLVPNKVIRFKKN